MCCCTVTNVWLLSLSLSPLGVGKTSLVTKYVTKTNPKQLPGPTIGASFSRCRITIEDVCVIMEVWDTAGQEKFRSMAPMYYRGANAALLVFDLTNYSSFVEIKSWITELHNTVVDQIVLTLVGNKCDLPEERKVTKEEATLYANSIGGYYFETSSFTNQGFHCIEKAFKQTALGLIHLSGEGHSMVTRYEPNDTFAYPLATAEQSLLMHMGLSVDEDSGIGPAEEGRVEQGAFSIDHIAHGDEHRTGCCW